MPEVERTPFELSHDLATLGVESGSTLLVHASYRSIRPVAGGPKGLVEALLLALGSAGTLVMPCWSSDRDALFDADLTHADEGLGILAETFRRYPDVQRSRHRFAFAAFGPKAKDVLADPICFPPHGAQSPVGRVREMDGQVLLLGVPHSANTTIHLGELEAGAAYCRFKHCTELRDGRVVRIDYGENDHCCERFTLVDAWLREAGLQREGHVGRAYCRLMRSRDLVQAVAQHLHHEPLVFLHPEGSPCDQCNEAHASLALR